MIDIAIPLWFICRMNTHSASKRVKDIQGQRFGRLTVVRFSRVDSRKVSVWMCRCDCGTELDVDKGSLVKRHTQSCGCLKKDKWRERIKRHGHTWAGGRSPEYTAWVNMVARCNRENHPQFHLYGGRGITVCERWLMFENFLQDVGSRPSEEHSIHRIDNDSGYIEGNVKWATWGEQQNAKRTNHRITFGGQTMNLMQWAEKVGVHYVTLHYRLKRGWSIERALTTPLQKRT